MFISEATDFIAAVLVEIFGNKQMIQIVFNTRQHWSWAALTAATYRSLCVSAIHPPLSSGRSYKAQAVAWGSLRTHLSPGHRKWREGRMWKGGWRRSRPSSRSWMFLKTHKRTGTRKGGSHRPRDTKRNICVLESAMRARTAHATRCCSEPYDLSPSFPHSQNGRSQLTLQLFLVN